MLEKEKLLKLLVCPCCRQSLFSFKTCAACGAIFTEQDNVPALFPKEIKRTVSFEFSGCRSTKSRRFSDVFVYPKQSGSESGIHHLDAAHHHTINAMPPSSAILEVGCGGAQMRNFINSKGHLYVGTDISKKRVNDKLQSLGGPDILCDAHFLPFADQSFDAIYSAAVTEHLACPHLVAQEIFRCLKPGGYYLGNVSFMEPWHDDSFFHMSPLGAFELLTQANFDVVNIWPSRGYSGFSAIMGMGNKATIAITFLGRGIDLLYRWGNKARNFAKHYENWSSDRIEDAAKVSGATDWIARRPNL